VAQYFARPVVKTHPNKKILDPSLSFWRIPSVAQPSSPLPVRHTPICLASVMSLKRSATDMAEAEQAPAVAGSVELTEGALVLGGAQKFSECAEAIIEVRNALFSFTPFHFTSLFHFRRRNMKTATSRRCDRTL
jgi:hypothetical protein